MSFWREKTLEELSPAEWESLCDGCGKCCLVKLENDDGEVFYTDIACQLFDGESCRCRDYARRTARVKECVPLTPETVRREKDWMPKTCAYRLLAEGKDLPAWHPLLSGDARGPELAGHSMKGRTRPEGSVKRKDWTKHILDEEV